LWLQEVQRADAIGALDDAGQLAAWEVTSMHHSHALPCSPATNVPQLEQLAGRIDDVELSTRELQHDGGLMPATSTDTCPAGYADEAGPTYGVRGLQRGGKKHKGGMPCPATARSSRLAL
jgi:hypothetical protein